MKKRNKEVIRVVVLAMWLPILAFILSLLIGPLEFIVLFGILNIIMIIILWKARPYYLEVKNDG